jgi:hypothetical protein
MNSNYMKFLNTCFFTLLCVIASLVLTGCGGGSASTTSTENNLPSPVAGGIEGEVLVPGKTGGTPATPEELALLPVVSVGSRQFADPNVLLFLRGTVTAAEGAQIVKTLWTQVAGPQVAISSPLSLNNIVLLPDVSVSTLLEFRLTAEDDKGKINSATLSIFVTPVPTFVKVVGEIVDENDSQVTFTLNLNAPSTTPVTVSYVTRDGTAIAGTDYVSTSGSILFAVGETSKTISVPLINDRIDEPDESFSVQATAVSDTNTGTNSGSAIIRVDKELPLVSQTIGFQNSSAASVAIGQMYRNSIDPNIVGPGSGILVYESSNPLVATVDAKGNVEGLSLGTVIITATKSADNIYAAATASYEVNVVSAMQFTNSREPSLTIGQIYNNPIDPNIVVPGTGTLVYQSSNPLVASVDAVGTVEPLSLGTAIITATKSGDDFYFATAAGYEVNVVGAQCVDLVPVVTGPIANITTSGDYFDAYGWLAFDATPTMSWISQLFYPTQAPAWIAYAFDTPETVTQYSIFFTNGSLTSRAPMKWEFQGSNDGLIWVTLDDRLNEVNWAGSERRSYNVSNPAAYRNYRLFFTEDNDPREGIVVISIGDLALENCNLNLNEG